MRINAALPPGIRERNYSDQFITLVLQSPPGAHIMVRAVAVRVVVLHVLDVCLVVVRVVVVFVRTATLLWLSCKSCVARQAMRSRNMWATLAAVPALLRTLFYGENRLHVRYCGVPKFWAYGSVCCACVKMPGLPRQPFSRMLRSQNIIVFQWVQNFGTPWYECHFRCVAALRRCLTRTRA